MKRKEWLKEVCPTCEEFNGVKFTGCSDSNIKNLIEEIEINKEANYNVECKFFRFSFESLMKKIIKEEEDGI